MNLVRRILNALWLVLGVMAISFLFFGEVYDRFQYNFRLILYLGLVSVVTIVFASTVNIWFRRSIERKMETNDDPTVHKFLRYVAVFVVYATGTLFALLDNRSSNDISEGKPIVRTALIAYNDSSVTIRAWTWARDYSNAFDMRCDLLESIKKRFESEGIEIPLPYRTVVFKDEKRGL